MLFGLNWKGLKIGIGKISLLLYIYAAILTVNIVSTWMWKSSKLFLYSLSVWLGPRRSGIVFRLL